MTPTQVPEIRAWRDGDEALVARAGANISPGSLRNRFCAGVPSLPHGYLRMIGSAPRWRWDAQVALHGPALIGWAEFSRLRPDGAEAELAILVVDAWQRRGVGSALVRAMLPRAAAAGIAGLTALVEPSNVAAREALRHWFTGGLAARYEDGLVRYDLALPVFA